VSDDGRAAVTAALRAACGRRSVARLTLVAAVAGVGVGSAPALRAQPALSAAEGRQAVTVGVAIEPALVLTLGYSRRAGRGGRGPAVGGGLTLPTTAFSHGAWRADLLVTHDRPGRGAWRTPVAAAGYLVRNRNTAGTMLGVGAEVRAAPGRYGRRGGIGVDLGWQVTAATRVQHTALARAAFDDRYPAGTPAPMSGPRDGWYRLPAQRYRVGLAGQRTLGRRESRGPATLWAAGGATFVRQRQGVLVAFDLAQVPVYAETGLRVAW